MRRGNNNLGNAFLGQNNLNVRDDAAAPGSSDYDELLLQVSFYYRLTLAYAGVFQELFFFLFMIYSSDSAIKYLLRLLLDVDFQKPILGTPINGNNIVTLISSLLASGDLITNVFSVQPGKQATELQLGALQEVDADTDDQKAAKKRQTKTQFYEKNLMPVAERSKKQGALPADALKMVDPNEQIREIMRRVVGRESAAVIDLKRAQARQANVTKSNTAARASTVAQWQRYYLEVQHSRSDKTPIVETDGSYELPKTDLKEYQYLIKGFTFTALMSFYFGPLANVMAAYGAPWIPLNTWYAILTATMVFVGAGEAYYELLSGKDTRQGILNMMKLWANSSSLQEQLEARDDGLRVSLNSFLETLVNTVLRSFGFAYILFFVLPILAVILGQSVEEIDSPSNLVRDFQWIAAVTAWLSGFVGTVVTRFPSAFDRVNPAAIQGLPGQTQAREFQKFANQNVNTSRFVSSKTPWDKVVSTNPRESRQFGSIVGTVFGGFVAWALFRGLLMALPRSNEGDIQGVDPYAFSGVSAVAAVCFAAFFLSGFRHYGMIIESEARTTGYNALQNQDNVAVKALIVDQAMQKHLQSAGGETAAEFVDQHPGELPETHFDMTPYYSFKGSALVKSLIDALQALGDIERAYLLQDSTNSPVEPDKIGPFFEKLVHAYQEKNEGEYAQWPGVRYVAKRSDRNVWDRQTYEVMDTAKVAFNKRIEAFAAVLVELQKAENQQSLATLRDYGIDLYMESVGDGKGSKTSGKVKAYSKSAAACSNFTSQFFRVLANYEFIGGLLRYAFEPGNGLAYRGVTNYDIAMWITLANLLTFNNALYYMAPKVEAGVSDAVENIANLMAGMSKLLVGRANNSRDTLDDRYGNASLAAFQRRNQQAKNPAAKATTRGLFEWLGFRAEQQPGDNQIDNLEAGQRLLQNG